LQNIFIEKIIKNISIEEYDIDGYILQIGIMFDEKYYEK
jgi:hypothetical protein